MAKAKHTAGPWKISAAPVSGALCVMSDTAWICGQLFSDHGMSRAEADANARVIATAPETLAMLEQITASANDLLNEMARHPERQGNWGGLAAHVQMARTVLAFNKDGQR